MPQLSDLVEKRKFVKKEFRPWDLSGSGTVDHKQNENRAQSQPIENYKVISSINQQIIEEAPLPPIETGNVSGNDLDNIKVTTGQQRDNKGITKRKQSSNTQVTFREHKSNITDNVSGNTESIAFLIDSIRKLVGIQKNIFYYVINVCSSRGLLETGNILTSDLAFAANCTIGSAKTSLIRIVEKNLVIRLRGKSSRGGHMVLGITKEIQAASIQAQQVLFTPFKKTLTDNVTGNELGNSSPYSSSNINTTTTLPENWEQIDFSSLAGIGFSKSQLLQLYNNQLNIPEVIQESINHFTFGLEKNPKIKSYPAPLNVLMGVLRKGLSWSEPNYVSPKELALRQMLERKRKQKEQMDTMVKELIELEFPEWKKKLTQEEINNIVPPDVRKTNISAAVQAALRSYFTEKVVLPRLDSASS